MKKTQLVLIGLFIAFLVLPLLSLSIIHADGDTVPVSPGGELDVNLGTERSNVKGSFSATGIVVAWISNSSGGTSPPPYALWTTTDASGNFDVALTPGVWYHLNFYNPGASTVQVTYNLEEGGIAGFQLLYLLFGILALSLFSIKKKFL